MRLLRSLTEHGQNRLNDIRQLSTNCLNFKNLFMNYKSNQQNLLSIHEAAALLKVSTKTLRRWEEKGILLAARTEGKHRRYSFESISTFKKAKNAKKVNTNAASVQKQIDTVVVKTPAITSPAFVTPISTASVYTVVTPQEVFLTNKAIFSDKNEEHPRKKVNTKIFSRIVFAAAFLAITVTTVNAFAPKVREFITASPKVTSNNKMENVLADTSTLQDLTFNLNIPTKINANLFVGGDASTSGNLTVKGENNSIAGILTLTGNTLSSTADLTINPIGGGVRIGTTGTPRIDLAGGDLYISDQLEVNKSITIGGSTISNFVGTGLTVVNGVLNTSLGTTIENGEIADNTITESKLLLSNDASDGKILSYNTDTGGFKWIDQATAGSDSPFQTTSNVANLVTSTNDVTIGAATDLGKLGVSGDSDEVQLLVRGNSTQTSKVLAIQSSSATNLFTVDNSGNLITAGSLTVNSDAISDFTGNGLTLSSGSLTIQTIASTDGLSATTSNGSGLEVLPSGIGLLQGCADGQLLKWIESSDTWGCANDSGATSAVINVKNNGVAIGTNVDTLNFTSDFTLTESPSGTDNISIADNSLNFSELSNSLVLDATTSIAFGASNYNFTFTNNGTGNEIHNLSSTGDLLIQDNGTTFATFNNAGGIDFSPNGTSNLTINTDSDSALKVTGLASGSGSAICIDGSNNIVTCTTGSGGLSGSGTSGQIAYFNGATSATSEASGFSWDATNNRLGIGTDTPNAVLHVSSASIGKALAIFNETGDQDILTASASGTTVFTVARTGQITASSSTANADSIKISPNASGSNTFTGTLTSADLTGNVTWTLPDSSGTVILSGHTFTGDVTGTLGAGGTTALTIAADSVALGTDTTGNYIASITGNSQVAVSGSGSESAAVSLSINGNSIDTVQLASTLTFSDGDLIDLSSINTSSTVEGLLLPQATSCSAGTAEGQVCWDTDNDFLSVGTGSGTVALLGSTSSLFTLAATSGSSQTISAGDTATIAAGTGITTTAGSTDTVTIAATLGTSISNAEIDANTINWDSIADAMTLDANTSITAASALSLTIGNNVTLTTSGTGSIVATDLSCTDCVALGSETTGNYVATVTGNSQVAVSGSGSESAGISLSINNNSIDTAQLASTLTFADGDLLDLSSINTSSTTEGLKLPQNATACSSGTAEGQVCWDSSTDTLYIGNGTSATAVGGGSSFTSFTAAGDSGSNQTISNGNTLSVLGGSNGIDTVGSATDTITLNLDTTEIGSTTFGTGSAITWTFDASGGTDTTIAFGNDTQTFTAGTAAFSGTVNLSSGVLQTGGTQRLSNAGALSNITGFTQTSGSFNSTLSTTNAATFNSSTANSDSLALLPQSTVNTNSFTGTITTVDLTAARTWTLPDATGTVCLTTGNCAGSGGGITGSGTSGQIAFFNGAGTITSESTGFSWDATNKKLGIGTDTPNGLLQVTGAAVGKSLAIFNETGDQNILTASASGTTVASIDRTGQITLNTTTANADKLALVGNATGSNSFTGTVTPTDLTANRTYTLPDATGDFCLSSGNCAGVGGVGNVSGPGSSTDNAIARFDLATGKIIKNSGVIIDNSNNITGINSIDTISTSATALGFAGAGTITSTGTSALTLDSGTTGVVNIATGTSGKTINIATDNTNADTINIGSALDSVAVLGTSTITGATTVNGSGSAATNIGTGTSTGTITIGRVTGTDLALNDANWNVTGAGAANFVSFGATTPGTGAFTTLSSTGNTTIGDANSDTLTINAGSSGTGIILADTSFANCSTLSTVSNIVTCGAAGGSMSSFTAAGDTGTPQTISDSNTLSIVGGTNGIDTVASATDTITLNLDTTEIGSTTFGTGSASTWTFDASAGTDTTIAFGNDTQTFTTGTATFTGNVAVNGGSLTTTASTATLFNTNAATLSIGGASTTALNIGTGNTAYTAINLGTGTGGNAINIGTNNTNADTIGIGSALDTLTIAGTTGVTGATTINGSGSSATNIGTGTSTGTITIGRVTGTDLALNDANWNITGAGAANFVSVGATTPGTGAFTTLSSTGATTIGNNSSTVAIDSTSWDISSAGVASGFTGLTSSGTINFSGLTASSGVYTDGSKNLTSTAPTSGTLGYWSRTGTTLSPSNAGDAVTTTGNISTTSTGTITSAGLLTGQLGLTASGAAINLNAASNFVTNINTGSSTGSVTIGGGSNALATNSTTLDMAATGAIQINSSAGTIGIGNNAVAQAINIGTGAAARTITIGNNTGASALALTSGTGSQSFTSSATTNNAFAFVDNALTSANLLALSSTSTALTSGKIGSFDWSPTSATTATGDLFNINIGANGTTTGNIFSVSDSGSNLFTVSETGITANVPASFTSAGDVSMAYDLQFTNQTASYIKSKAPLYIDTGESFESNDLTLRTYNSGKIVLDNVSGGYATLSFATKATTGDPSTCAIGDVYFNSTDATIKACTTVNTWATLNGAAGGTITGSGTTGTLPKFTSGTAIGDSLISESGSTISLSTAATITASSLATFTSSTALSLNPNTGTSYTLGTTATTLDLFNATPTTINFGGAATTALNIGNGSGAYTAINLGSGSGTHTINIAGTGATSADTVNIGTGGTSADTINIGGNASTTALNLTSGTGAQTFRSSVATGTTTSAAWVFNDTALTSGTGLYLTSSGSSQTSDKLVDISQSGVTTGFTGNLLNLNSTSTTGAATFINLTANASTVGTGESIAMNALTTGKVLGLSSSSTAITTAGSNIGSLLDLTASGAMTAFTGSIANINVANASNAGDTGNALNINLGGAAQIMKALNIADATTGNLSTTGAVAISMSGAHTGTAIAVTDATATGKIQTLIGNSLTSGTAVQISSTATGLTTAGSNIGSLFDITESGAMTAMTGNIANINLSGANAVGSTGNALNINIAGTAQLMKGISFTDATTGNLGTTAGTSGGVLFSFTGAHTGYGLQVSDATATGTAFALNANSLTSGVGQSILSTATGVTSGNLLSSSLTGASAFTGNLNYFDWTPGSSTTATGDLLRVHIGANGSTSGYLFNVVDDTTSDFSVSETQITSALPHQFTAAGDVSMAYDLQFTNQTASYIKSNAPLYLQAGETFENNNLTLQTYGTGAIVSSGKFSFGSQNTLTANSTTPSVTTGDYFVTANTSTTLISNFTSGTVGQEIFVNIADANTDFDCTSSNIACGTTDITTPASGDILHFIYDGTNWSLLGWMRNTANNSNPTNGVDLAEFYPSSESLQAADVISVDSTNPVTIKKATDADGQKVFGVISTQPGLILGEDAVNSYKVALAGRVPVAIDPASETIQAGDLIGASSVSGKAKKVTSGYIIGRALEAWTTGSSNQLTVFVNPIYVNGDSIDNSQFDSRLTTLENNFATVSASLTASASGVLANFSDVHTNTLSVLGDSTLSDTVINGKLNVGAMVFDNVDQSINAIGTLKIQSLALGNIELENGLVTIDTLGNVVVNTITAQKYKVAGTSAGTNTMGAGTNQVTINTTAVTANSLIFVTPKKTIAHPMAVTQKVDGTSFTVSISSIELQDIEFDWWIVDKTN